MSSQEYIRSITTGLSDELPTLSPLIGTPSNSNYLTNTNNTNIVTSLFGFLTNIKMQTWIIIILCLALFGINIFAYLAKGTQQTVLLFEQIFGPIFAYFGYNTLSTTKQTIETTVTGTKAGVDIIGDSAIGLINDVQQNSENRQTNSTNNSTNHNNYNHNYINDNTQSIMQQQTGSGLQQNSLVKALDNAKQSNENVVPDDASSSIQTIGKSGWCYIGEEQGVRTCSEIGVNDVCMSGDIFPSQSICINPKLRA